MACTICSRVKPSRKVAAAATYVKSKDYATDDGIKLIDLPCDLISNILSRLPLKPLLRCRLVSKSWNRLTRTSQFTNSYSHNQNRLFIHPYFSLRYGLANLFLYQQEEEKKKPIMIPFHPDLHGKSYRIETMCNGFLLLSLKGYRSDHFKLGKKPIYVIYNPITRETINNIPNPPTDVSFHVSFGFDIKTHKYKLVLQFNYILTLGETCWRKLTGPYSYDKNVAGKSVFFNGKLYWPHTSKGAVFSLDICSEKCKTITYPPLHETLLDRAEYNLQYQVVECDNKLALSVFHFRRQLVQVWSLVEEEETWIPQFTCSISALLSKHYCKKHKFRVSENLGNDSLMLYHLDENTNLEFDLYENGFGVSDEWWKRAIIYTPSSGGGRVFNFMSNSLENHADFCVLPFVPNLASLYTSTESSS